MKKLIDIIKEAESNKQAIGHFNFSNIEILHGLVEAASELNMPIMLGLSEGERKFFGVAEARAVVESLRNKYDIPIFLSADHTYSMAGVKEVVDAGFDAVVIDGSKLPIEENIAFTKEAVAYTRAKNPDMLVEGELGYIGTSSKVLTAIPADVLNSDIKVSPELANRFVAETGVDLLAPAVGNLHGMLKNMANPNLDIELIKQIRQASGVPLVLHGGSGITVEDFKQAILAGISIVHINTELRLIYRDTLKMSLQENPDEISPYKIMAPVVGAVAVKTKEFLKLFTN
ncbi:MAG: class II fructose-bisphosphate aldolase [Candidatus Paceibacterota bacterium]